jgi:hypothetical protein
VWVFDDNRAAYEAYQRLGFRSVPGDPQPLADWWEHKLRLFIG